MTIRVLHIMPHMGTGVGKALSGLAIGAQKYDPEIKHEIILLEKPILTFFMDKCTEKGINIYVCPEKEFVREKMLEADIIQVEWWHHPLAYKFLYDFPKFPVRLVMWDHVNGCNHPYLRSELTKIPSRFVFTGPYSYDNPYWSNEEKKAVKQIVPLVHSSGGFDGFADRPLISHEGFNIGYYGTLDYAKMSSKWVEYCAAVSDIPGVRFTVVGSEHRSEKLKADIKKRGMENKIRITGFLDDPTSELTKFDVAAYLLNPYVFDTTENALLEQMAMGIPPIVFSQCSEMYIVKPETGFKVMTKEGFVAVIKKLYENKLLRQSIGESAKQYVLSTFSQEKMVRQMHEIYREIIYNEPAKVMDFKPIIGDTPYEWFLSCIAPDPDAMKREVMEGDTKQSPKQFLHYFPEDQLLQELV